MKFGKIIDGVLVVKRYGTPIIVDGISYITNDETLCRNAGYKEVVYVDPTPDDGYNAVSYDWVETDTQLVQSWAYEPIAEGPQEPTIEERLELVELLLLEMLGVEM